MGKKKSRAKYTSKGERRSVAKKYRVPRSEHQKMSDKMNAFLRGRKVYFTIDNPNPHETNKRKIRVLGSDYLGNHKKYLEYNIMKGKEE